MLANFKLTLHFVLVQVLNDTLLTPITIIITTNKVLNNLLIIGYDSLLWHNVGTMSAISVTST